MGRNKSCEFCANDINKVNYKDIQLLEKYITDRGKVLPRRITGNCATHQKSLTKAIKRARNMALLPFKID
jgi:small subunit ribosomal protein S18